VHSVHNLNRPDEISAREISSRLNRLRISSAKHLTGQVGQVGQAGFFVFINFRIKLRKANHLWQERNYQDIEPLSIAQFFEH